MTVKVQAHSAIVMNAKNGMILFEKNGHLPSHPASLTKIATALFVLELNKDMNSLIRVSKEALEIKAKNNRATSWSLEPDGTMMGLHVDELVSLEALLHGLLLVSGNDAANVIAQEIGGSIPKFMEQLQEYLINLGCQNTQFNNPHGLTHPTHLTTAYDLALITAKALAIPKFRQIVSTLSYLKPATNKQPQSVIKLSNLLLQPNSCCYYKKAIGVKTGYTQSAGYNFVTAAENAGLTVIATLLGCPNEESRYRDAKQLFEEIYSKSLFNI